LFSLPIGYRNSVIHAIMPIGKDISSIFKSVAGLIVGCRDFSRGGGQRGHFAPPLKMVLPPWIMSQ